MTHKRHAYEMLVEEIEETVVALNFLDKANISHFDRTRMTCELTIMLKVISQIIIPRENIDEVISRLSEIKEKTGNPNTKNLFSEKLYKEVSKINPPPSRK